jgi:uncharacterized membrane protein
MVSDKFRRQFTPRSRTLQAEGLIDTDLYEQLSERYQFNTLDTSRTRSLRNDFARFGECPHRLGYYLCSSELAGVATQWQGDATVEFVYRVNTAGFYLWRQPKGAQHRLGHGLLC